MAEKKPDVRLLTIAKKWLEGTISAAEKQEFDAWYQAFDDRSADLPAHTTENELRERILYAIKEKADLQPSRNNTLQLGRRIGWAACLLVAFTATYLLIDHTGKNKSESATLLPDAAPGTDKATLTLADGTQMNLRTGEPGIIVADNQVTYTDGTAVLPADKEIPTRLMSLSTPKGGQYRIVLSDGTKVWLNAASKLTYPAQFTGNDRTVEISGEAYFEIHENKEQPFVVRSEGQLITVLGTKFNISAFSDEDIVKTTLTHGAIRVSRQSDPAGQSVLLRPGEQSVLSPTTGSLIKQEADAESELAWKNGLFKFNNTPLPVLMRQIARWYDIDVAYEGHPKPTKFFGEIERSYNLSDVLKVLEHGDIRFRMEKSARGKHKLVVIQ